MCRRIRKLWIKLLCLIYNSCCWYCDWTRRRWSAVYLDLTCADRIKGMIWNVRFRTIYAAARRGGALGQRISWLIDQYNKRYPGSPLRERYIKGGLYIET